MITHKHIFQYQLEKSDVNGVVPHTVSIEMDGDINLPDILERFEAYLRAVGFVPPENTHLDFV